MYKDATGSGVALAAFDPDTGGRNGIGESQTPSRLFNHCFIQQTFRSLYHMLSLGLPMGNKNTHSYGVSVKIGSPNKVYLLFGPASQQLGKYPIEIT